MSIEEKMYCSDKAKTLSSMKELCGFSFQTCSRHKGCIHPPLVNIKPSLMNCICIGDVLIRNVIFFGHSQDHYRQKHSQRKNHHIQGLERVISSIMQCELSYLAEIRTRW